MFFYLFQRSNRYIGMGRIIHVNNLTLSKCVELIKKHTGLLHVRLALAKDMSKGTNIPHYLLHL
jgi:hypothetical protein